MSSGFLLGNGFHHRFQRRQRAGGTKRKKERAARFVERRDDAFVRGLARNAVSRRVCETRSPAKRGRKEIAAAIRRERASPAILRRVDPTAISLLDIFHVGDER